MQDDENMTKNSRVLLSDSIDEYVRSQQLLLTHSDQNIMQVYLKKKRKDLFNVVIKIFLDLTIDKCILVKVFTGPVLCT